MKILFIETNKELTKVVIANLLITFIFFSLVTPGIIWDKSNTVHAEDQNLYHLHQIETFVKKPLLLSNYPSTTATTPGHHVFLSWVSQHFADGKVGPKIFPIRIANALFSLGLLLSLWWLTYIGGTRNVVNSTYLVLPLLFSYQFLGSAIWVMTDNAALLWVCLTLWLLTLPTLLNHENFTLTLAGIFAALAVAWRQTYVWLLAPIVLRVFMVEQRQKWQLYLATLLPPLLVLCYFIYLWHGLTPPEFQSERPPGFNLAVPSFVISLFGIFGLFYIGYLSSELKKIQTREILSLIVISVIVGFGIAILFPSSYDPDAGRRGGWLWEIAKRLPNVYDRSVLFLVLCPLGTVLISLWCKATYQNKNRNNFLIFVSMIAWIAINTVSVVAFQRYYEVLILITLAFIASRQVEHFRRSHLGILILTGLMGAISLQKLVFDTLNYWEYKPF